MGAVGATDAAQMMSAVGTVAARDPGSTRVVYAVVVALAVLGVALALFAWWLVRTTRPDPEVLAPLEAIDSRQWRRLDPAGRRRLLDELRPEGAEPTHPEPLAPAPDEEFSDAPAAADVRELADAPPGAEDVGLDDQALFDEGVGADEGAGVDGASSDDVEWERWDESLGLRPPGGARSESLPPPHLP